jgi:methionine-rich copper-binding protein CopC
MRSERRPRHRRRRHTVHSALAVTVAAVVALSPGTALADGALAAANPPAGAALTAAPQAVVLQFSDAVALDSSHVRVSAGAGAGADLADGEAQQPGPYRIRVPIRSTSATDVTVAYHIMFADGTNATGAYRFSVGTGVPPAPLDAAARQAATASVAQHAHRIDGLNAILLTLDGAVLITVLLLLRIRRRDGRPMTLGALRRRPD